MANHDSAGYDYVNEQDMNTNYLYKNIAGAATTLVKSGPGILHDIVINAAVSLSVTTIYDSVTASGTKIGTITQPLALLTNQLVINYDKLTFTNGLTITTSAADNITVVYE